MTRRIRRRHRRSARREWFAFALFLLAAVLIYRAFSSHRRFAQPESVPVPEAAFGALVRPALDRSPARTVYPYSLISGGAYSVAELDAALRNDPIASVHYAGFHRDGLRMTNAPGPLLKYASYRIGSSVYWTSHPVHISAGESLITDGTSLARARCGNQLSDSPREPVTRMEPMEREMETPETLDLAPDLNQGALADMHALDRLLVRRPPIAPPVSALAFEIFPFAPLATAPAFSPSGAMDSARPWRPAPAPPAEYSLPAPGEPGESSLQLTLQTFQQKAASTTVLQVPQVSPPVLPGVITGVEGFQGEDPLAPSAGPAPPRTTSSGLPLTASPEPGEPSPPTIPGTGVVPEPVAGALLCTGLSVLYIAKRRRAMS
jgi:hypothetical protein